VIVTATFALRWKNATIKLFKNNKAGKTIKNYKTQNQFAFKNNVNCVVCRSIALPGVVEI